MADLPKSVVTKNGKIELPLSWKEAYHLRYVLRQHVKRFPNEHLAVSVLRRLEHEQPEQAQRSTGNVIPFPRRPSEEDSRVLLTLERGVIVAADFDYVDDNGLSGVTVRCNDGSTEGYLVESPTMAEYFRLDLSEEASYAEKKEAVMAAAGWEFDEECEWLQVDEYGDALPEYETDKVIDAWLNSRLSDVDFDRFVTFSERISTQYTPGFIIWDALSKEERASLGMRESDLGGPASSVPCISTSASIDALNEVLERHGLPFTF